MTAAAPTSELLDRLPPQDLAAEKALLGSILLNSRVLDDLGRLRPEDFYANAHQRLYAHLDRMYAEQRAIDVLTLVARLKERGDFEAVGGSAYLAEVVQNVPVARHAAYYAGLVRKAATLRTIIRAATEMLRDAYEPDADPKELLEGAERALGQIQTSDLADEPVSAMQAAKEMVEHLEAIQQRRQSAGCMVGIAEFDEAVGGVFPGELSILAARPSMGKSALALQIAYHVASAGRVCYLASLEMSRLELITRITCGRAGVNGRMIRTGSIGPDELRLMATAANEVSQVSLWIHDSPGLGVGDIRRSARRLKRHGLDLIVVDYLQLLTPADAKVHREQQVAAMTRGLKGLARALNVPVLCLCQLNRAAEDDEEPQLRNLRESGAIEQDADMVMFLGRRVSWLERERGEDKRRWADRLDEERARSDFHTQAKLWLRKNRNGELGTFRLRWVPEQTRFEAPTAAVFSEFDGYHKEDF